MRMRLLTVLVPITLVIAAAFLVPFTVDIDVRRDQITAQISRDMNIDITAHGPVTLRLLPSPALQFENIISVINRPDGEQPDGEQEAQGEQDGKVLPQGRLWLCLPSRLMPVCRWSPCWTVV